MKKLVAFALVAAMLASASLALAQSAPNQTYFSQMPMFSFWGSQASTTATPMVGIGTVPAVPAVPAAPVASGSAFQELWAQMPMLQFFNFTQQP